jgi:hypothetical protein
LSISALCAADSKWTARGPDRLPFRMARHIDTNIYTNAATGQSVPAVALRNRNDLSVTNNGDGTLAGVDRNVTRRRCMTRTVGRSPTVLANFVSS